MTPMNRNFTTVGSDGAVLTVLTAIVFQYVLFTQFAFPGFSPKEWILFAAANISFLGVVTRYSIVHRRLKHQMVLRTTPSFSTAETKLKSLVTVSAFLLAVMGGLTGNMWLVFPAILLVFSAHDFHYRSL